MRFLMLPVAVATLFVVAGPVLVSRAVADDPDYVHRDYLHKLAVFYYGQGIEYKRKGDRDRAIAAYSEAIRADPKFQAAYVNRGNVYETKGDHDRAMADYNEAIRLDPRDAGAYVNRGNVYEAKGDHDRAIADYSEAIRLDSKDAGAYVNRGNVYGVKGDNDRAMTDYNEAIRLDPKDASAYYARGTTYQAKGDNDRAIADHNEAIRINPEYADPYRGRGLAYLYSGNPAKALADVRQASELDPKDAYNALWVDILGQRNNVPSRLSQAITKIDMTAWPAPVVRLFLGQMTPAVVLAAADDPNPTEKKFQVCQANFYSGELALRTAKDEAARLFRLAASDCPRHLIEWGAANAELKALAGMRGTTTRSK